MNKLTIDKKADAVGMLCEGTSIRSVERITGIHRDTIMRLGVRRGEGCQRIMDKMMRNLPCRLIQVDEVWGYVGIHVTSTPVFEVFRGKVIWDGIVETFDLEGYPKAKRCYVFPFTDDDKPNAPAGKIIFQIPPVDSPESAVKVAIASKARK